VGIVRCSIGDKMSKKEAKGLEIKNLKQLDALMKLRIVIISIFSLSTLSILMIFVADFVISALLILISYVLVFVLMLKLLIIKKL
jgi:hypothetical protein